MITFTRRWALAGIFTAAISAGLFSASPAQALTVTPYTPAALAAAQQSGQPYLLDFYATWCSTCRAQERVIEGLIEANPAYRDIEVIRVDWDEEERGELVRRMQIPRRSTLVVLDGETELGRLVAATSPEEIAKLLDLAL